MKSYFFVGERFYVSPLGIVSGKFRIKVQTRKLMFAGLFWVPSGVAAIIAVKNAGLAVSQGTWSSLIVMVRFLCEMHVLTTNRFHSHGVYSSSKKK